MGQKLMPLQKANPVRQKRRTFSCSSRHPELHVKQSRNENISFGKKNLPRRRHPYSGSCDRSFPGYGASPALVSRVFGNHAFCLILLTIPWSVVTSQLSSGAREAPAGQQPLSALHVREGCRTCWAQPLLCPDSALDSSSQGSVTHSVN